MKPNNEIRIHMTVKTSGWPKRTSKKLIKRTNENLKSEAIKLLDLWLTVMAGEKVSNVYMKESK